MSRADHERAARRLAASGALAGHVPLPESILAGSVPDRFRAVAQSRPDGIALRSGDRSVSFAELDALTDRIARAVAQHAGERVALLTDQGPDAIAAMLAVLKAGRAFVSLDPTHPAERIRYVLRDAEADLLLFNAGNRTRAETLAETRMLRLALDDLGGADSCDEAAPLPDRVSSDALAYVLYTSGSTGEPKGVMQSHRNLLHFIRSYTNSLRIGPRDHLSMLYSLSFGAAILDIFTGLLSGATLHTYDVRRHGSRRLDVWLERERITVLHAVPSLYRSVLALREGGAPPLTRIRAIDLGGEPVQARDLALQRTHFGPDAVLVNHLACTEAAVVAQLYVDREFPRDVARVPAGPPASGIALQILGDDGEPVATGETGEITLESPYLCLGYWRKPELGAEVFEQRAGAVRRYHTGDLGRLDADGILHCVGRTRSRVNIRGHSVELSEVECALADLPGVADVAVVAWPADPSEPSGSDRLCGYLTRHGLGSGDAPGVEGVRAHLRERLPEFMVPAQFVFLEAMPLTATGKLDRRALPRPDSSRPALERAYVAPTSALERSLAAQWAEILDVDGVGLDDDFFALGGDSLAGVRAIDRAEKTVGRSLRVSSLLVAPTVRELAAAIESGAAHAEGDVVRLRRGGERAPLVLLPGTGGTVFAMRGLADAVGEERAVFGFHYPGIERPEPPLRTVQAISARLVDQLLALHPGGPFHFCGYSFGGLVAWEAAHQLRAAGIAVGLLALLDVRAPAARRQRAWHERLRIHARRFRESEDRLAYLGGGARRLLRLPATGADARAADARARGVVRPHAVPPSLLPVVEACEEALAGYEPAPQPGPVTLVTCEPEEWMEFVNLDSFNGWKPLAPAGLALHRTAARHLELFDEAHLPGLCDTLGTALLGAEASARL